eukprot:tig00021572_g22412.t1
MFAANINIPPVAPSGSFVGRAKGAAPQRLLGWDAKRTRDHSTGHIHWHTAKDFSDVSGRRVRYNVNAVQKAPVVDLNVEPAVLAVDCSGSPDRVDILLEAGRSLAFAPGAIVVGSEIWKCPAPASTSPSATSRSVESLVAGLMVRVVGVAYEDCELQLAMAMAAGGRQQRLRGTCARLTAEPACLGDIFEHLEMDYYEREKDKAWAPHAARGAKHRPAGGSQSDDIDGSDAHRRLRSPFFQCMSTAFVAAAG